MNILEIPDSLELKYQGRGYALAAVALDGGTLVDFIYCHDLDKDFNGEGNPQEVIRRIANNPRFKAHGQFFEVDGYTQLVFGMISCREFHEL